MTRPDEPPDLRALNALTKLGSDTVQRPTAAELDRGLHLLFARIGSYKSRRAKLMRGSLAGVVAALCALLAVQAASAWRARVRELPALAYRVEGGSVLAGGYLRESGDGGVRLIFNEGTQVKLLPGARGRLRSVDKEGTRVVVDQGTASFDVAHSKERRWLVEAGPFSVAVKGTFFTVSWEPSNERFELRLRQGSVIVSGPIASGDIELRAGQRLLVDLPKAETLISEEHTEAQAEATSAASGRASTPGPEHDAAALAPTPVPPPPDGLPEASASAAAAATGPVNKLDRRSSWAEHLAHGHWDRILEEVQRQGVDVTLETASSEDLFALADAARYRRRTDLARAALLAQRRRFPGSARSLDAMFLLGRVEESRDRARAMGFYDEYLERAGKGTYAAEAWGRKMVLTNELQGRAAARPIAEEYLRRFPKGSYAGAARALCGEP